MRQYLPPSFLVAFSSPSQASSAADALALVVARVVVVSVIVAFLMVCAVASTSASEYCSLSYVRYCHYVEIIEVKGKGKISSCLLLDMRVPQENHPQLLRLPSLVVRDKLL